MSLLIAIACAVGGLALGALVGFRLGENARGSRREYWGLNAAVVVGCGALNFAGLAWGRSWLAYGALGLMGGLITGMKYGFFDSAGGWRDPGPGEEPPSQPNARLDVAEDADDTLQGGQAGGPGKLLDVE